jgi:hypothetical protein
MRVINNPHEDRQDTGMDSKQMTRDQFLTEMMGECWHIPELYKQESGFFGFKCDKCKEKLRPYPNTDFSTPEGFFKLWNYCKDQEWWSLFIKKFVLNYVDYDLPKIIIVEVVINTLINDKGTFANAVALFRGWKEKK